MLAKIQRSTQLSWLVIVFLWLRILAILAISKQLLGMFRKDPKSNSFIYENIGTEEKKYVSESCESSRAPEFWWFKKCSFMKQNGLLLGKYTHPSLFTTLAIYESVYLRANFSKVAWHFSVIFSIFPKNSDIFCAFFIHFLKNIYLIYFIW